MPFVKSLSPGECVRIMTGAVVPHSAHSVVIQENVTIADTQITLLENIVIDKNIRQQGEEIQAGQLLFMPGKRIEPNIVGVLASQGFSKINVYTPLKIAIFSSGDELRTAGQTLNSGNIFESNLDTIAALLKPLPVELHRLGIIPDQEEAIDNCLKNASD